MKDIERLERKMREWAAAARNLTIVPSSIELRFRELRNPSELHITMFYEQSNNLQDMTQHYKNRDMYTKQLTILCKELNIGFSLPVQPFESTSSPNNHFHQPFYQ